MNKASNRKTNTIRFHLYEALRGVKFIEVEWWVPEAEGWEEWEVIS